MSIARLLTLALAFCLLPSLAHAQDRIVSLGSDVTEILFALGKGGAVVAVDDTSTFPATAASLPRLGYLRSLTPEPLLAQRPTMVLAGDGAGPEAVLRQVERAGVRVVRVSGGHEASDVSAKIRAIGKAVGAEVQADRLARSTAAALAAPRPAAGASPRMLLILASAPGRMLAAGENTAGDGFIRLAGGRNVFTADGYKPLSAEAALAAAPDVILVPSHVAEMMGGIETIRRDPILARTPAARTGRIIEVESAPALNFGPRLPQAIASVRARLKG
jgi:iron complex transport system substrate-binding protein